MIKNLFYKIKIKILIKHLNIKLYKIRCRNWILCEEKGNGAVGIKLEKLLGKKSDRYILPDYKGIEIKTKSSNKYGIHLFSCAFDNKPNEIKRLLKIFNTESIHLRINTKKGILINDMYIKIYIDNNRNALRLIIFKGSPRKYFTEMSWSFNELKNRLENKISYLVLVYAKSKMNNNKWYVKYYEWEFYKLINFNAFLNCIRNGYITINFNISNYIDKGTSFELETNKIEEIFRKIKRWNKSS